MTLQETINQTVSEAVAQVKQELRADFARQLEDLRTKLQADVSSKADAEHNHDGLTSVLLPNTSVEGFRIFTDATKLTGWAAPEGTIALYVDSLTSPTAWRLYVRSAKQWKYRIFNNT